MRVVRLVDEPDWQSRLSPIEEIFFATSPSAKTLRPDERQPFKERWLGRYIALLYEQYNPAISITYTMPSRLEAILPTAGRRAIRDRGPARAGTRRRECPPGIADIARIFALLGG